MGLAKGVWLGAGTDFVGICCIVFSGSGSWKVPGLEKVKSLLRRHMC